MAEIRTFIAIGIDQAILARLAELQQQLRQVAADVAWARPEGMHITLKFLGNVAEERIPAIAEALERVARQFTPFTIAVAGTGVFPNPRAPRVVWAGIREGSETLCVMAAAVDRELDALGFPREQRPFRAHLTLGRVKSPAHLAQLTTALTQHANEPFGAMRAGDMRLMRSELSPQGARYTALHHAVFSEERSSP